MAIHNPQITSGNLNGQRAMFYSYEATRNGLRVRVVMLADGTSVEQIKYEDSDAWSLYPSTLGEREAIIVRVQNSVAR